MRFTKTNIFFYHHNNINSMISPIIYIFRSSLFSYLLLSMQHKNLFGNFQFLVGSEFTFSWRISSEIDILFALMNHRQKCCSAVTKSHFHSHTGRGALWFVWQTRNDWFLLNDEARHFRAAFYLLLDDNPLRQWVRFTEEVAFILEEHGFCKEQVDGHKYSELTISFKSWCFIPNTVWTVS